jgi:hypothetical protein
MRVARALRSSPTAGAIRRITSVFVVPGFALLVFFAAVLVTISRTTVGNRAGLGRICTGTEHKRPPQPLTTVPEGKSVMVDGFTTDQPCWASGITLEKNRHYTLWVDMTDVFFDKRIISDVVGFKASVSWPHWVALPIRRWFTADWFQLIARIGAKGDTEWPLQAIDGAQPVEVDFARDVAQSPGDRDAITKRERARPLIRSLASEFVAPDDGELFLYVNDAIAAIPFGPTIACFYKNNSGGARVTIERMATPPPPPQR